MHRNETRGVSGLFFDDLHEEFERDLVFDSGTLIGLQSGVRAESILISLPPLTRPATNLIPRNWLQEPL